MSKINVRIFTENIITVIIFVYGNGHEAYGMGDMKVKIALCDDNALQLSMIEDIVIRYCEENRIDAEIKSFESGLKLLEYAMGSGSFDVYILDMIMPDMDGMEVARKLRNKGDMGHIIFLTSSTEYAIEAYDVAALYYLVKPIDTDKIYMALDRAKITKQNQSQTKVEGDFFEIIGKDQKMRIRIEDILFVDIISRRLCFHMVDGQNYESVMLRTKFCDGVSELSSYQDFVVDGKVLVNKRHIKNITTSEIEFSNGVKYRPSKNVAKNLYKMITS